MTSVSSASPVPFLYRFLIHPEFRTGRYIVLFVTLAVISLNVTFVIYRDNIVLVGNRIYGVVFLLFLVYLAAIGLNLHVLVPRLLLKKKYGSYICFLVLAVLFTIGVQTLLEYLTYKLWNLSGERSSYFNWITLFDVMSGLILNAICVAGSSMPLIFRHWADENRRMDEIEKKYLRTRVDTLKEQVNPHLLLNVLHRSGALAASDSSKASVLLMKLSQILRYQLYDCNRNYVSLNSEIRFLTDYLQLGQLCCERLQYTLNVGGTVAMTLVPPLLFIPFIRYAIEDAGAERIEIGLNAAEDTVDFSCRYVPAESASAFDFRQIRQRLTLLYKEHFRLSVDPAGLIQLHLKMQDNGR